MMVVSFCQQYLLYVQDQTVICNAMIEGYFGYTKHVFKIFILNHVRSVQLCSVFFVLFSRN